MRAYMRGGESRPLHVRAAVLVSRRPAPVKPSSDCRPHPLGQGCVGWRWWCGGERERETAPAPCHLFVRQARTIAALPPSKTKVSSVLSSNQSNTNQSFRDRTTGCQLEGWLETSDIEGLSINQAVAVNILCVAILKHFPVFFPPELS